VEVVIDKLLSYMLLLMVPEQVRDCCFLFILKVFCVFCFFGSVFFCFLPSSVSPYLESFFDLKRKSFNLVLAFLIVNMEIS
jgi:hypothetical protein